jgi:hypothetical protein
VAGLVLEDRHQQALVVEDGGAEAGNTVEHEIPDAPPTRREFVSEVFDWMFRSNAQLDPPKR